MAESTPSKLSAILGGKCPRCRKGNMFQHGPLNYMHFADMHKDCPCCNLHYEVEPGFWQGAMYVTYSFSIAILITCFAIITINNPDTPFMVYVVVVTAIAVALAPLNFRYGRIIYMHLFSGVSFKPGIACGSSGAPLRPTL